MITNPAALIRSIGIISLIYAKTHTINNLLLKNDITLFFLKLLYVINKKEN